MQSLSIYYCYSKEMQMPPYICIIRNFTNNYL